MPIPIPKRSLRSFSVLVALILGPFLIIRHLSSQSTHSPHSSPHDHHEHIEQDAYEWRPPVAIGARADGKPRPAQMVLQEEVFDPLEKVPARQKLKHIATRVAEHRYLPNGLLVPNPQGQHPIYDLLKRGQVSWNNKLKKSSKTLGEAVNEYRRRYGRSPPKGFDRWWKWAKAHDVQLPDEYDQIHVDLEPFFALTPSELQELRKQASAKEGMYTLQCPGSKSLDPKARCTFTIQEDGLNEEGRTVARQRAEAQLALLEAIEHELEEVEAVFYSHDVPWQFVGHEYKGSLEEAAALGEYYNTEEHELDTAHLGWASACAPHRPLREGYDPEELPDLEDLWNGEKTFIWDHKASMDPCNHPTLVHLVGFLSGHGKGPGPSKDIFPVMAMCKTMLHSDVLAVSEEAWTEDVGDDPAWDDKKENRLLWRGKTTGIYFKDSVPWEISQRINLVSHGGRDTGRVPVYDHTPRLEPVGQPIERKFEDLNEALLDVAFVDEAIQCDPETCRLIEAEYKFGGRKDWVQGNQYKYLLDIDGNGWSARFKRLMSTNSLVLKSTIFPEWYTDRIQPWVHYVPIKADLTDLYDVMTFFHDGHDDLAKEIAIAGKEWSKTFWRKEDMVAYQFRLFLELSRLLASDRDAATYHARGSDLD